MKKQKNLKIFGVTLALLLIACTKEITEEFILNFKVNFPQETTIGFLDTPIETQFSIEGGSENAEGFEMKYNAKKAGYFIVNDEEIVEGEFVSLPGKSPFTIAYVGTKTGANTVEITVRDPSQRQESFQILYEIKNTAFDFEVVPSLNELYVGQIIDLELSIEETSVSEYDVFYVNASENATGAGEILVDDEILDPDTASKLSAGKATWQFRATEVGEIELRFTAVNRFGIKVDQTIKLRIGETPDFTFSATLNNNTTITVNNPAAINFDIEETGLSSTYQMTYSSSNAGSLVYNEVTYAPGEEIPMLSGSSVGVYTGTIEGAHKLDFTVVNANDEPVTRVASAEVSYVAANGEPPVISLNGPSIITQSLGETFNDPGATATDDVDGDISANIIITGEVDVNVAGEYTLIYRVTDSSGNTATISRIIRILENSIPVITLNGESTITLSVGDPFTDLGAIATDEEDGDISGDIVYGGSYPGNTDTAGTYTITYNVTDSNGLAAVEKVRTIIINPVDVEDTEAPVITLEGASTITLTVGTAYVEPGFIATDNVDGDITGNVVVNQGNLDTNTVGSYVITYNVSDAAGNAATEVTRTVDVVAVADTVAPEIELEGETTITLTVGTAYSEPGYTATDNVDGDITSNVVVDQGNLDTNTIGTYTITYNVSDAAGNAATEVIRTIEVEAEPDVEAPVITLEGEATLTITVGTAYVEPGFTATDNVDGDITANVVVDNSSLDVNTPGSYAISYNVSDNAGNAALEVIRTVVVEAAPDTEAPVITLEGESSVVIQKDEPYVELGATALDNVDGVVDVTISGTVNTAIPDTYIIAYNATDAAGNSETVNRTVKVNAPPVADFTVSPTSGTAPLTVSLNNSASSDSDGTIGLSNWKFNGAGSNTAGFPHNINKTFDTPGDYVIRLEVTDNDGGVGVLEKTVKVLAPGTPTWDLSTGLLTANPGTEISMTIGSGGSSGYIIEVEARADSPSGILLGNLITGSGATNTQTQDMFTMPSSGKVYFIGQHNQIGSGSTTKIFVDGVEVASVNMSPSEPIPR